MKQRLDLVGQVYGKLRVVKFAGLDAKRNSQWECICECGNTKVVKGSNLTRGHHKSCGCGMRRKRVAMRAEDHPDFGIFCGILSRCFNKNEPGYPRYGGRGVSVCQRWVDGGFWVFIADMGDRPSPDHSIDRIDNSGNYEPSNCRWATSKQQGRNRRTNRHLTYQGKTLTMAEWSEVTGINYSTLRARARKGWTDQECIEGRPGQGLARERAGLPKLEWEVSR